MKEIEFLSYLDDDSAETGLAVNILLNLVKIITVMIAVGIIIIFVLFLISQGR